MKLATVLRPLPTRFRNLKKRFSGIFSRTRRYVDRHPMRSFFVVMGIMLALIVISNVLTSQKAPETKEKPPVKTVSLYRIGSAPKITVAAQTKKSGVIQITALTSGVVSAINVQEGSQVYIGNTLLSMSSNYSGGNTFSLQRQIAQQQYQTNKDTFDTQKDIIKRQRELAEKSEDNADELRNITDQSLGDTRALISQNEEILGILNTQITTLEQNNPNPTPAVQEEILGLKMQRTQFQAAVNQGRQALRSSEYSASDDKPAADIADITRDLTLRQLDVQEKQLALGLEVSRLQAQVAAINEALMFPSSPFNGTIQRVYVKVGQQVNPGTPLFIISQDVEEDPITAVVYVSADVANRVSRTEASELHIGNKTTYSAVPSFVSTDAVQGTLYAVYYAIPDQYHKQVVSEGFISVDIPVGMADTTMTATYIPLDAVYQTREKSYVFVTSGNKVASRDVELGSVYGRFVEVISGLKNGDAVILDRNIIQGDEIKIQ